MSHIVREEFKWETADGRVLTVDKITDEHLANIIMHVKKYKKHFRDVFYLLCFLRKECLRRGLGINFIDGAPHPYTDYKGVLRQGDETLPSWPKHIIEVTSGDMGDWKKLLKDLGVEI